MTTLIVVICFWALLMGLLCGDRALASLLLLLLLTACAVLVVGGVIYAWHNHGAALVFTLLGAAVLAIGKSEWDLHRGN